MLQMFSFFLTLCFCWALYAQTAGSINYNTTTNEFEFYDGSGWQSMDNGSTLVACSTAGMIEYNTTQNRLEFCDGSFWKSMMATDTATSCSQSGQFFFSTGTSNYLICNGSTLWEAGVGGSCAVTTTNYLSPGSYTYVVPANCTSVDISVWGAGGGGGGDAGGSAGPGGSGGSSIVDGTIIANGGSGGESHSTGLGSAGGTASGGDTNQNGVSGYNQDNGRGGRGGHSFSKSRGGRGGVSSDGYTTQHPGGGGGGGSAGGGNGGGGGGGGGYATKTLTVAPGQNISVVVGSGGAGGPGNGLGGEGASGRVVIKTSGGLSSFDCSGSNIAPGDVCNGGALYAGVYNSKNYMVTPSGCTDSATPTCDGTADTLSKAYAGDNGPTPSAFGVNTGANSSLDGETNTTALSASYADTYAAKYCADMTFGGYSDWFLPSTTELNVLLEGISVSINLANKLYVSSTETAPTECNHVWLRNSSNSGNAYASGDGITASGTDSKRTSGTSTRIRCVRTF